MANPIWLGTPGQGRIGFQFAPYRYRTRRREWSMHWMRVVCHVECDAGEWSFQDECMTVEECDQWLGWIESYAAGEPLPPLTFIEPPLEFEALGPDRGILVRLRAEALVDGRFDEHTRWREGVPIPLRVPPAAAADFAGRVRRTLRLYPER